MGEEHRHINRPTRPRGLPPVRLRLFLKLEHLRTLHILHRLRFTRHIRLRLHHPLRYRNHLEIRKTGAGILALDA